LAAKATGSEQQSGPSAADKNAWVLVDPLPGAARERVLEVLRDVSTAVVNARGTSGTTADIYNEYIRWANKAAGQLSRVVRADDVDRLVLTRRYWLLQSMGGDAGTLHVTNLLNAELDERARVIEEAHQDLKGQIERWSRDGVFVLADTSFYIEHPAKLEEVDFAGLLKIWEDPVHLLVPILVVDELDGLKRSSDRQVRWRAGYTLAVIDRLLPHPSQPAVLRAADFSSLDNRTGGIPRGEVRLEIVFDPPGHSRLPISDDEIIDRTVAVQALAGRPVRVLTYDTGQSTRARRAGLAVEKPTVEPGPEPPPA
jgi:hypothetical protein